MTSTHLARGRGESARRAPYQPFLTHRAETHASDLAALPVRILHSLVYLPVTDPLQGQSPSVSSTLLPCCPTHQEIRTYPWTWADHITCFDHKMWQKWWHANSRPGNIHFYPWKPITRLQGNSRHHTGERGHIETAWMIRHYSERGHTEDYQGPRLLSWNSAVLSNPAQTPAGNTKGVTPTDVTQSRRAGQTSPAQAPNPQGGEKQQIIIVLSHKCGGGVRLWFIIRNTHLVFVPTFGTEFLKPLKFPEWETSSVIYKELLLNL